MTKLQFKRKKKGGKSNWGAGLDFFLKNYYNDLDKITEDNYFRRHNKELINEVFKNLFDILNSKAIPYMKRLKDQNRNKTVKNDYQDWINKANRLNHFFKKSKRLSEKVIAINSLTQFLRATY